jgi:hypothetical protein
MTIRIQKHEKTNGNYGDICLCLLSDKYLLNVYEKWRKNPFKSFSKKVIILKMTDALEGTFGFAWKKFDVFLLQVKKEHYRKPRLKKAQDIIDNKLIEFNHYPQKSIFFELQEEVEETKSFSYETLKDAYKRVK